MLGTPDIEIELKNEVIERSFFLEIIARIDYFIIIPDHPEDF